MLTATLIITIAIILLAIVTVSKGIKIVPQADIYVIERLGKYNQTLRGGLNFIIPFIDSIRVVLTNQEQMIDIPKQSVITKDNVNISIDGIVFCKVQDAKEATYNVVNFKRAIKNLAMTTLRSEIGGMALDDTLSNRETLNTKLNTALGDAAQVWGIKITRVEISDISVPAEIQKAMNLQMEAERKKRATITDAEAKKTEVIRNAEALKEEKKLEADAIKLTADATRYESEQIAEGQKNAMEMINEAMKENQKASEFMLAKDSIEAFGKLAASDSANKVIVPYQAMESFGNMALTGDAFFKGISNERPNT